MGTHRPSLSWRHARAALRHLPDILTRARCAACDLVLHDKAVFCAPCVATVVPSGWRTSGVPTLAVAAYGGAVAEAIQRFKYRHRPDLARPLASLLLGAVQQHELIHAANRYVITPVPLHAQRRVERGYNQAALLARQLATFTDWTLAPRMLSRIDATKAQAELDATARQRNVAGAFRARAPNAIEGRHVLLVDDVRTTGATLRECAAMLHGARASSVTGLVVAVRD